MNPTKILVYLIAFLYVGYMLSSCGEGHDQDDADHQQDESHEHADGDQHSHADADVHEQEAHEHESGQEDGEDHAHKAHHGGVVKTAGDHHIEMVREAGRVDIYLLDGQENVISNEGVTGSAVLQLADNMTASMELKPVGDTHFVMELEDPGQLVSCIISFMVGDKTVSAKFESEKGHDHDEHDHEH